MEVRRAARLPVLTAIGVGAGHLQLPAELRPDRRAVPGDRQRSQLRHPEPAHAGPGDLGSRRGRRPSRSASSTATPRDRRSSAVGHWDSRQPRRSATRCTLIRIGTMRRPSWSRSPARPRCSPPPCRTTPGSISRSTPIRAAKAPSGNYFYLLRIQLTTPAVTTLNAFKVRTGGAAWGARRSSPRPSRSPISPMCSERLPTSGSSIPTSRSLTRRTYDGIVRFLLRPAGEPARHHRLGR